MNNLSPLSRYHERFKKIKAEFNVNSSPENLLSLIETNPGGLNNFFMAALGMSTLLLRLGAVIQLCNRLKEGQEVNGALFTKQVIDNLHETLPSDTNWRNIWSSSAKPGSDWERPCIQPKGQQSLLERFVTFRNKFAHQNIRIATVDIAQLCKAIEMFTEMEKLISLFDNSAIEEKDGKFYFVQGDIRLELYPFIQKGEMDGLPYLFQGLYKNKTESKLINTHFGNESKPEDQLQHLNPFFQPLKEALKGGAGQVWDHSERIAYYRECFVGRERERNAMLKWCKEKDESNILAVYSEAGMGKGALIADVVYELQKEKTPILYHFCGSGIHNSLHAILYHFILQGNKLWNSADAELKKKLERLPSKYIDAIHLYQNLLSIYEKANLVDLENSIKKMRASNNLIALMGIYDANNMNEELKSVCEEILQKDPENKQALEKLKNVDQIKNKKNLVIIIDGLDEAAVANPSLNISDWFYTYNEKEEREAEWISPPKIRWIFTYRKTNGQKGYQFPFEKESAKIELLQPLQGLDELAVSEALKYFNVSEEFKKAVISKGAIVNSPQF